jgi:hypothetical protein
MRYVGTLILHFGSVQAKSGDINFDYHLCLARH